MGGFREVLNESCTTRLDVIFTLGGEVLRYEVDSNAQGGQVWRHRAIQIRSLPCQDGDIVFDIGQTFEEGEL